MAKTRRAELRLNAEDHDLLRAKARGLGISFSELLIQSARAVVTASDGDVPDLVIVDATTWSGIRRELNHQGVNLNQIARSFNTCALVLERVRKGGGIGADDYRFIGKQMSASREELVGIHAGISSLSSDVSRLMRVTQLKVPTLPPGAPRVGNL